MKSLPQRLIFPGIVWTTSVLITLLGGSSTEAQIRTKKPDRGVYQPPVLGESAPRANRRSADGSQAAGSNNGKPLVEVPVELVDQSNRESGVRQVAMESTFQPSASPRNVRGKQGLQRVNHEDVILVDPASAPLRDGEVIMHPASDESGHRPSSMEGTTIMETLEPPVRHHEMEVWAEGEPVLHDGTCDGCSDCYAGSPSVGCDGMGCDNVGCDGVGCDSLHGHTPWYDSWWNGTLAPHRDRWFGGVDAMLMWRRGGRIMPLVTTGPATIQQNNATVDNLRAGALDQDATRILAGADDLFYDEVGAGGRLTLGTWLDRCQDRSLVFRGWVVEEETYRFGVNQGQVPVISRPFFNVSDNQAAEQDTQSIAFPNRVDGSISIHGHSDVSGGDISVRQFWYSEYGGSVDLLYGYQYLRLDEDLVISTTSTSLNDDFAPVGAVLAVEDAFDAENEFHGGQFGIASHYREGCWSFRSLAKIGFGSLRRRAILSGASLTRVDAAENRTSEGLLVQDTNAGTYSDDTFAWAPELDFKLGWQRWRNFDATVGYNIVAVTDAWQVSGLVDPNLAVNLSSPPTGRQRPGPSLRDRTFYVQGIHFGLQYVY